MEGKTSGDSSLSTVGGLPDEISRKPIDVHILLLRGWCKRIVGALRSRVGLRIAVAGILAMLVVSKATWLGVILLAFRAGPGRNWNRFLDRRDAVQLVNAIEDPSKRDDAKRELALKLVGSGSDREQS